MSKYNNCKVVDISKIPNNEIMLAFKEFAEGSKALEECLYVLYGLGIKTVSCCKGQHMNNDGGNPYVLYDSYITFQENQNWKDYLSEELISDRNVIIGEKVINYFGKDNEDFFQKLCKAFSTGKKNNQDLLMRKHDEVTYVKQLRSYIYSLIRLGFNGDQIQNLAEVFALYLTSEDEEDERKYVVQLSQLLKKYLFDNKEDEDIHRNSL